MAFKFFPLGIPFSSSFAVTASHALYSLSTPPTASYAEYAVNTYGPMGGPYTTISGSKVTLIKQ